MEKESYSIDEILSEVKKRRAGQQEPEFKINDENVMENSDDKQPETSEDFTLISDGEVQNEPEESIDDIIEAIIDEPAEEESDEPEEVVDEQPSAEVEMPQPASEPIAFDEPEIIEEPQPQDDEESVDLFSLIKDDNEEIDTAIASKDEAVAFENNDNQLPDLDNFDIPTHNNKEEQGKKVKSKKSKKAQTLRRIIIVLLLLVLAGVIVGGIYIDKALKQVTDTQDTQQEEVWGGMGKLEENFPEIQETGAQELSSLQDMIKTWYYNGAPCSSTHVLNVLLIGEDTRGTDILEGETRADSAIIASINIDTKQITLTSILRDAYAYWENTEGDESSGVFEKINGAMSIGDVHTYIKTVEKLYKIDIDNYVIVNFDSFEKIVDEVGGVTLELTSAEIREINNHPKRYGHVTIEQTFDGTSGELQLNGKQALAYCRIRELDSDNMRADRQKTCLLKIFDKVKQGSRVTQLKVVNAMLPYVKTGFNSNEIVSIAKYALSQGWLNYNVEMTSVPYNRINERGIGGTYYGAWIWRPDYPADAYYLQTLIYGKSSITLAAERVDVIGCRDYGFYKETLSPCYAVIHNNNYGETTTYEFQTKKAETENSTSN